MARLKAIRIFALASVSALAVACATVNDEYVICDGDDCPADTTPVVVE